MEKLELKHLAGYLPYELKCKAQGEGNKIFDMQGFTNLTDVDLHEIGRTVCEQFDLEDVFPILRPLSDLTEEIEHNGEKFVAGIIINSSSKIWAIFNFYKINNDNVSMLPYDAIEKLYEWHFDIHGLIEKGLAIDINIIK